MNATCFPDNCFCESLHNGFILQPSNTFSALAFVIAGLFIFFRYRNAIGIIYGTVLTFIGVGTAYYHARLGFVGQTIDVSGMYLLVTFVILLFFFKSKIRLFAVYYITLNTFLVWTIIFFPVLRRFIFVGLLLALIWVILRRNISRSNFFIGLGIMALGGTLWVLDIMGIWCDPNSILQGHALWHISGAIAAVFLFRAIESTP